jgi:hypothetical protein
MHKNCGAIALQNNIRSARKVSVVKREAKAEAVKQ